MRPEAMNLTCPVCQRLYKLDPKRVPANARKVKCKTCGYPIPLNPPAAKKKPIASDPIKIKCLYCSKKYSIDKNKLPQNTSVVKCKKCGHSISLKPPPPASDIAAPAKNKITCLYCSRTYRLDHSKIPDGLETIKCKSCGHAISLMPSGSNIPTSKPKINASGASIQPPGTLQLIQPVSQTGTWLSSLFWKKAWLLAAVLAIIVVGASAIFTGSDFTRLFRDRSAEKNTPPKDARKRIAGLPQPFLSLNIDVPSALNEFEKHFPEKKKDFRYKTTVSFLKSLNLEKAQLYLFPDAKYTFLPVLLMHGSNRESLKEKISTAGFIKPLFVHLTDNSYRINKKALPKKNQNDWPFDRYRVELLERGAIIAPRSFLPALEKYEILLQTQVAQMTASLENPDDLAVLAVRIPESFQNGWETKIQKHPAFKHNPKFSMIAALGCKRIARDADFFKQVDMTALSLRSNEAAGRTLKYAQLFRNGMDGRQGYKRMVSGDMEGMKADGMVSGLSALFSNPRYQHKTHFKNNRLELELTWPAKNDSAFLAALSEAVFGQMIAWNMNSEPSVGHITACYAARPFISASIDASTVQYQIPGMLQQSNIPGVYPGSKNAQDHIPQKSFPGIIIQRPDRS